MQHHEDTIEAFVQRVRDSPDVLAVVVTGSVARGLERPDSDVDLCVVVSETAFLTAWDENRLSYVERDGVTYDGGYYDIKLASPEFLRRAAERGDDPMRASLLGARVAWSRLAELAALLAAISSVPEEQWVHRMASFIAQVRLHGGYFLKQAVTLRNPYLLHHAAVHMVGAGGRALLALNRTLFQGPKYLDATLATLERIPTGYADVARAALQQPGEETGTAYLDLLEGFHEWPVAREVTLSTFVRDNELAWYSGSAPPEYA